MDLDSNEARQERQDLDSLAKPQGGVEAMASFFAKGRLVKGVTDNGDAATRPVPTFGNESPGTKPCAAQWNLMLIASGATIERSHVSSSVFSTRL